MVARCINIENMRLALLGIVQGCRCEEMKTVCYCLHAAYTEKEAQFTKLFFEGKINPFVMVSIGRCEQTQQGFMFMMSVGVFSFMHSVCIGRAKLQNIKYAQLTLENKMNSNWSL